MLLNGCWFMLFYSSAVYIIFYHLLVFGVVLYIFRPNRLGRFGLMAWRLRPAEQKQIHHRNEITQACHTQPRYELLTDHGFLYHGGHGTTRWCMNITLPAFSSAIFFISEFFGDDLASYRNSCYILISVCLLCKLMSVFKMLFWCVWAWHRPCVQLLTLYLSCN